MLLSNELVKNVNDFIKGYESMGYECYSVEFDTESFTLHLRREIETLEEHYGHSYEWLMIQFEQKAGVYIPTYLKKEDEKHEESKIAIYD